MQQGKDLVVRGHVSVEMHIVGIEPVGQVCRRQTASICYIWKRRSIHL